MARIVVWSDPPRMSAGAPMPAIRIGGQGLLVAYIVSSPESYEQLEEYAIVQFNGVLQHTFGYPNDEALGEHPLFNLGIKFYAFNEIVDSPYVAELGKRNARKFPGSEKRYSAFRHWLVAFHDETLEVIGESAKFLGRTPASSGDEAISLLGT